MWWKQPPPAHRGPVRGPRGAHRDWEVEDEVDECTLRVNRIVDLTLPWLVGFLILLVTWLITSFLLPANATAHIKIFPRLLQRAECDAIVAAAEETAAERGGWETERHAHYPTTDFAITSVPKAAALWNASVGRRVMAALEGSIAEGMGPLHTDDLFVVKYSATQPQRGLTLHRDHSHFSFNIALNGLEAYEGGGTHIASLGPIETTLKIDQGDVLMHHSGLVHEGVNVTAGTRYILVGFVMGNYPWWYLWTHSWGFTANCITIDAPPSGAIPPLCVSRLTALHRMFAHVYSTLAANTPALFGVPVLLIVFAVLCFILLVGCVLNTMAVMEPEKTKSY